ncbi:hypothetical protein GCM10020331_059230 [Ectobacillus funiculus]
MSLLGIGSAQIDLVLLKKTYRPDEYINGHFLIKGGAPLNNKLNELSVIWL